MLNLEGIDDKPLDKKTLTVSDRWILHKLNSTAKEINDYYKVFRIGEIAQSLYDFFWNDYCDWYVEIAKVQLNDKTQKQNTQRVLKYVLEETLKMLHPIMPHITESIWQLMPFKRAESIMVSEHPVYNSAYDDAVSENKMDLIIQAVKSLRNIRQVFNIPPSIKIKAAFYCEDKSEKAILEEGRLLIASLAKTEEPTFATGVPSDISGCASAVAGNFKIVVPLAGLIDIDKEIERQKKKLEVLDKEKQGLLGRFKNQKFVESAPEEVVLLTKERIAEIEKQSCAICELIKSLA